MFFSRGKTLYVGGDGPGNYTKIQDAIDNASDGDTVFVYNGTYYENVVVNKSINLTGEDKDTTIIDGGGSSSVILIFENNYEVTISGFTIQNAGFDIWDDAGIEIHSGLNIITGNIIRNNARHGILTHHDYETYANTITQNIIIDNKDGITLDWSFYNDVYENYVVDNSIGIFIGSSVLPSIGMFSSLSWKSLTLDDYENHIFRNMVKNNGEGINIEAWFHTYVFENNVIENNVGINLAAPYLTSCNENFIYQNNIRNNSYGILIQQIGGRYNRVRNNEIYHNNFIDNNVNTYSDDKNKWDANYWDNWIGLKFKILRFLPYRIRGTLLKNIDWNPAQEPYDITNPHSFEKELYDMEEKYE